MPVSHLNNSVAEMWAAGLNTLTEGSFSHLTTGEDELLARLVSEMTGQSYSHLTTGRETLWELLLTQAADDGITFDRSTQSSEEIAAIIANGVTAPGGEYEGPLDIVAGSDAVVAYSLRAMTAGSTADAITIRRDSDDTEQTFALVDNAVDIAAVATFISAGDGFAAAWKDQSGNAKHVAQVTAADQPEWVADAVDGKPGLTFAAGDGLLSVSDVELQSGAYTFFAVIANDEVATNARVWTSVSPGSVDEIKVELATGDGGLNHRIVMDAYNDGLEYEAGGNSEEFARPASAWLLDGAWAFGSWNARKNGATVPQNSSFDTGDSLPTVTQPLYVGGVAGGAVLVGKIVELIIYSGVKSDPQRLAIRQNIAAYYGITL